jgi:hypothetical protein
MRVDLSKYQSAWQDAPAERNSGGSHDEVRDGTYQVKVYRVELKESKQGNPMLEWELDIMAPKSIGRKLWRRNMLGSADNIHFLKADLGTCGLTLSNIDDLNSESTLRKLIGVTLEIVKKTKGEYSNVYFNKKITLGAGTGVAPPPANTGYDESDIPF